jgi:hypothetical protein
MKHENDPQGPGWVDLLAFLGVLALGGILLAVAGMTAPSLTAACGALGGLYAIFERFRRAGGPGGANGPGPGMPGDDHVEHRGPPGIAPHD